MHIKLTIGVFVFALGAAASTAADELDELKALVRAQAARIEALKQKVETLTQTIATTGEKVERAEMKFEAVRDTAEVAKPVEWVEARSGA